MTTILFKSQEQAGSAVMQNLTNKGFTPGHPTPGCTYVVQPPRDYQDLFQDLQRTMKEAELPIAPVRIPHATVMLAKVIDRKPGESWKELEKVHKIYHAYFLYFIDLEMRKEGSGDYQSCVMRALLAQESLLAKIASTNCEEQALKLIEDGSVREAVLQNPANSQRYDLIKKAAIASLNSLSFKLNISQVELTNNGSIIFKLKEDPQLLQMRLDLIVGGQGISKWPVLSVMKHGWSTIGYTIKVIDADEKQKIEAVIGEWVKRNEERLDRVAVNFSVDQLGCLAVRANDFHAVKRVTFPMAKRPPQINTRLEITSEDLRMTPRAGEEGPSPIPGDRSVPSYGREIWDMPIDREIVGKESYEAKE